MFRCLFLVCLFISTLLNGFQISNPITLTDSTLDEVYSPRLAYNDFGDIALIWEATVNDSHALQYSEKCIGQSWSKVITVTPWLDEIVHFDVQMDAKNEISIWHENQLFRKTIGKDNFKSYPISCGFNSATILPNGNFAHSVGDLSLLSLNNVLKIAEYSGPGSIPKISTLSRNQSVLDRTFFLTNRNTSICLWRENDTQLFWSWYKDQSWSKPEKIGNLPTDTFLIMQSGVIDEQERGLVVLSVLPESESGLFAMTFSKGIYSPLEEISRGKVAYFPECSINQFGDYFVVWQTIHNEQSNINAAYKLHSQDWFTIIDTAMIPASSSFPKVQTTSQGDFIVIWEGFEDEFDDEDTAITSLWGIQFSLGKQAFLPPNKIFSVEGSDFNFDDFIITPTDQGFITWTIGKDVQVAELHW